MNHDVVGQYLGFYVEAFGSQKQWEVNAEKVEAAGGALLQLLGKHPLMTNEMRNAVYSAKVRSLALLGSDIWGWRRAHRLDKSDSKSLRVLTRAHNRTKLEATVCCGLLACIQFGSLQQHKPLTFWFQFWNTEVNWSWPLGNIGKQAADNKGPGRAFDMVTFFQAY